MYCVCVLVFADLGIVFRVQDWKRRLRCACWGAARALCIAEHRSEWFVNDILLCGVGCGVCVLVIADWGIVFRVQDCKRRLGCSGWGAARALCIAEYRSRRCVKDFLLFRVGCGVWGVCFSLC